MNEKRFVENLISTLDAATAPGMREAYVSKAGSAEQYDAFIEELKRTIDAVNVA
ncbi:MAG: hypothetical protein K6G87_01890 [Butyrivibrio sp.]|uniref:hypothetical protein n=1 Tax=Butyrivibrio sp. TaxID=28121 RepID=UPI0025E56908|nr:hypothetical protein [Butyrivibrio sp.]MCR5769967.1 hypothetical protein [Butyrivibrio sp.]